jgi:DNA transformation protein
MPSTRDFADYCCELLASLGPCTAKRMFGGWGISVDGLTVAIIADLGGGEKLWLKASPDTQGDWEAQGCARFTYDSTKDGATVQRSLCYYSAPEEAMEAAHAMAPWARRALDCALKARSAQAKPARAATKKVAKKRKL